MNPARYCIRFTKQSSHSRLPGTALFYALLVTTLVGVVLTALISIFVYYRQAHKTDMALWRSLDNWQSAFTLAQSIPPATETSLIDLYGEETDSVRILHRSWGGFELVGAQALGQMDPLRIALVGYADELDATIILPDGRKPLVLAGSSQIIGSAIVPSGGVRTAVVDQRPYLHDRPVIGNIQSGEGAPPLLDEEWIADWAAPPDAERRSLSSLPDSLVISYFEHPLLVEQKNIHLGRQNWQGPVYLKADSLIVLDGTCRLDGAILEAPNIHIERGFKGRVQILAGKDVTLEEEVKLHYPSIVAIRHYQRYSDRGTPRLRIGANSLVEGFILGVKMDDSAVFPSLSLEQAYIRGRIVWEGTVRASGQLEGAMYCRNFQYQGKGAQIYYNYLVDFTINGRDRSPGWVEPAFWRQGEQKVAAWID